MKIAATSKDRSLMICLQGELDHHGAKRLMNTLEMKIEETLPSQLVLNFAKVSFMDSSGIAVVMRMYQRMREIGGNVRLEEIAPQARKVFEAAHISRYVELG